MMTIEGVAVDRIVKKYGTPVYVMVESKIRHNFRRFKRVFGEQIKLQYAVKCNSNLQILRIAREEGFELDCSSVGEIILGLLADFKPRQLSYTNLFKTEQDLHFAVKMGVQSITADSIEDLKHIAATAKKLRTQVRTVIRVNPMIEIRGYHERQQVRHPLKAGDAGGRHRGQKPFRRFPRLPLPWAAISTAPGR